MELKFDSITESHNVLFLPLKNESLKNVKQVTTLNFEEQQKITELSKQSYDVIVGVTNVPYSPSLYTQLSRVLKAGGVLIIQAPKEVDIRKSLLYAGFIDIKKIFENENATQYEANKSSIVMSSAPLNLSKKKTLNNNSNNNGNIKSNQTWKLNDIQEEEVEENKKEKKNVKEKEDIELIDEDTLLEHETEKVVILNKNKENDNGDCGVGKNSTRKPCKNCTCGRAQDQNKTNTSNNKVVITDSMEIPKQLKSSCNSCHLGDAFRCASCPYLGMPAFDPSNVGGAVKLKNVYDN